MPIVFVSVGVCLESIIHKSCGGFIGDSFFLSIEIPHHR